MRHPVSIGVAQFGTAPFEVEKNRARGIEFATRAFDEGADVVVLPEMTVHGYVADAKRLAPLAEPVPGPTTEEWRALAHRFDGYVCGGLCERDGDALYNTAVIIGSAGVILHYRKLHPFGDEKLAFRPGDRGLPIAHTRFGTVGVCVCYDLRFVEVVRAMTLSGADMILVPTAWLPGFDREKWDENGMCPQAHGALFQSNLSQCFIACASQVGKHGGLEFLGSSVVADPYGKLAAGPLSGDDEGLAIVEVDMTDAKRSQIRDPLIAPRADRRSDVYGITLEGRAL